ncbi:hypothetical protein CPJCM30710_23910 [Clostridium polyendosporum]|uniref:Uncharacterized protein n=1 Tax=Clostridium polyendosporum TaxID=69208 RepID=A0A919S1Y5_9CLOT|nr:hypothetical protein [Clostridium polyendosporum]GIM29725.1 hypothetical protein CPJCM30710_23910 [Clostridium polyendosporum]
MEKFILDIIKISFIQVVYALGIIVICGFLLEIIERKSNEFMQKSFGWKGILVTALIGAPVHELGHAIMCLVFRHKINEIKLIRPLASKQDGIMGFVSHSYNPKSLYQKIGNFFIGIGPIIFGSGVMLLSMKFLMNQMYNNFYSFALEQHKSITGFNTSFFIILKNIFIQLLHGIFNYGNLLSLNFWIFILIIISISSHMALSAADIKESARGIVFIYIVSLFLSLIFKITNVDINYIYSKILFFNVFLSIFLFTALSFSIIVLVINMIIYFVKNLCLQCSLEL